jgi:Protein of unknown function (DUF2971)
LRGSSQAGRQNLIVVIRDISIEPGELPLPPAGSEPELVYHYAGVSGLKGIIEDQCLWASDVWYMNDAREAIYGFDALGRALQAFAPGTSMESDVRQAALDRLATMENKEDFLQSYIACLSTKRDDLSQWRSYGRPRGFSIGFDRQTLQRLFPPSLEFDRASYRVVAYDDGVQNGMLADTLHLMVSRVPAVAPAADAAGIAWLFILESLLLAPSFKDKAFNDEDEIRLQVLHNPETGPWSELKFRDGLMGLTPYVELSLKDPDGEMSCLREIVVGPQANQAEAIRAARLLVACHELDVKVHPSDIPLRP